MKNKRQRYYESYKTLNAFYISRHLDGHVEALVWNKIKYLQREVARMNYYNITI